MSHLAFSLVISCYKGCLLEAPLSGSCRERGIMVEENTQHKALNTDVSALLR